MTHGTHAGYDNYGCRCEPCRNAGKEYRKKYFANPEKIRARRERVSQYYAKNPGANAAAIKRKKEKYKLNGRCPDCGVSVVGTGKIYCGLCTARKNGKRNAG